MIIANFGYRNLVLIASSVWPIGLQLCDAPAVVSFVRKHFIFGEERCDFERLVSFDRVFPFISLPPSRMEEVFSICWFVHSLLVSSVC